MHERLPELRQRYGIKSFGIFGSHVHGRQTKRSDIDLLVEFDEVIVPDGRLRYARKIVLTGKEKMG
ncbi:MAG: hypothetical protein CO012_02630 [Syntrophobacterales bacterium CG_4_8_14_3_um_filter_49_14]|nr:MAG: hypothetical protein COX52_13800 [Syntrophobacterales bacterium CG23_combo_of_CG06-09_8_20_14_all_48_27]PJA48696.1 MAG: hypothetical protein CO171_06745 [Syntrophobacterales bacterium CG_4_9_14_3_um_filter_49_8]PJC75664.1 MAG: hypothetical protein CO012_02630 [Syntrophobacterales bacterium CG_4_8_14_3_um_filter_49_14]